MTIRPNMTHWVHLDDEPYMEKLRDCKTITTAEHNSVFDRISKMQGKLYEEGLRLFGTLTSQ